MATASGNQLLLVDPSNPEAVRPYQGLHAVSPVLTGLAAPFVAWLVLAPRGFAQLGVIGPAILLLIGLAALVIFLHGVFTAGSIAGIAFDGDTRSVEIIETGMFSRRVTRLRFSEVASLHSTPHSDRDGFRYVKTVLALRNGDKIEVPLLPTPEELAAVRALLAAR